MTETETPQATPPPCERCGTRTFPSRRSMRSHDIATGQAVPQDKVVDTWRCPSCGREMPRT